MHRTPRTIHRAQYTIHCAPCTVHNTLCTVHRLPWTVRRTSRTVQRSPYIVHRAPCTVYTVHRNTVHRAPSTVQCTVLRAPYAPCIVHRKLCTVQHAPHSVQRTPCAVHRAPCTVHRVPCTVHRAQCTVHRAPCTVHRAQCTVHMQNPFCVCLTSITICYFSSCSLRTIIQSRFTNFPKLSDRSVAVSTRAGPQSPRAIRLDVDRRREQTVDVYTSRRQQIPSRLQYRPPRSPPPRYGASSSADLDPRTPTTAPPSFPGFFRAASCRSI